DRKTRRPLPIASLVSYSELDGAQVEKVKAKLSRTTDRGRKANGHYPQDQPRSCVFVGTTNDQEYLQDQTGNVRWWPVETQGDMDIERIVEDRDQLWAEAVLAEAEENLFFGDWVGARCEEGAGCEEGKARVGRDDP